MNVETTVKTIVANTLKLKADDIKSSQDLRDLGADSLDMLTMRLAIEKAFNVIANDDDIRAFKSVDSICEFLKQRLGDAS